MRSFNYRAVIFRVKERSVGVSEGSRVTFLRVMVLLPAVYRTSAASICSSAILIWNFDSKILAISSTFYFTGNREGKKVFAHSRPLLHQRDRRIGQRGGQGFQSEALRFVFQNGEVEVPGNVGVSTLEVVGCCPLVDQVGSVPC
jgi:hypothetical protein